MLVAGVDCGCETRKETIGSEKFWTTLTIAGTALGLALLYGGTVTAKTKTTLKIGAAGALIAIIADQIVRPGVGVK